MLVINWRALHPPQADLNALNARMQESLPIHKVCQLLVEITMHGYPWARRADLIPCYHPSQTYKEAQWIALPIPDPKKLWPMGWHVAQVKHAERVENPVQGSFQALILDLDGRQIHIAAGVADALYPVLDLSSYTSEDISWLVEWISNTYAGPLESTLKKLIHKGRICGQLVGETFLPEQIITLPLQQLHPFFTRLAATRPWISLEEIFEGLPDFSHRRRETALDLIRTTLNESPYRSLGGARWTTPRLLNRLDREVPRGLPAPHNHSNVQLWTNQDKQDLAGYHRRSMPTEARRALEELEAGEKLPGPADSPWRSPIGSVRLPNLNYHQITQAYFPVGDVIRVFAPNVHMVFVQFIEGDYRPYLLDRENGLLKALDPESLRNRILEDDIPAGTYLWLEHQGDEKYRIAPLPLAIKRMVPCKLAHLLNGELHIEDTRIPMIYEGELSVFKANMRFEEIEALYAEAKRVKLSVRDAIIYAIQEICAIDVRHRAYRLDIFNTVFLKRLCSPNSVSLLLYTQRCFEKLGGGYFRYKPVPDTLVVDIDKRKSLASRFWDDLISNPVPPDPVTEVRTSLGSYLEVRYPSSPSFAPELDITSPPGKPAVELEISILDSSSDGVVTLNEPKTFPRLVVGPAPEEAVSSLSIPLSELKPSSEEVSSSPSPPLPQTINTRRLAYIPKIPARALHKRSIFVRVFFSLRGWFNRNFRRTR